MSTTPLAVSLSTADTDVPPAPTEVSGAGDRPADGERGGAWFPEAPASSPDPFGSRLHELVWTTVGDQTFVNGRLFHGADGPLMAARYEAELVAWYASQDARGCWDMDPPPPMPSLVPVDFDDFEGPVAFVRIDVERMQYGADNRHPVARGLPLEEMVPLADGVAALFSADDVVLRDDGSATLPTLTLTDVVGFRYGNLCDCERFRHLPAGARCTGFLVDDDVLVTAGHCIAELAPRERRVVFGYGSAGQERPTVVDAEDVYTPVEVLAHAHDGDSGADFAVVRLDRPVKGRKPLKLSKDGQPSVGTHVFTIGHPSGLPAMYAGVAKVRSVDGDLVFTTTLDAYQGNSGSPVFRLDTFEVAGVLVRGDIDWVEASWPGEPHCWMSNVALNEETDGRGEDVMQIMRIPIPPSSRSGAPK